MLVYIASLVLIAAIVAAFLVAADRRDRRERVERAVLLQRIQAPHAAVHEHHYRAQEPVESGSGLPMTDGEMAGLEGGIPDPDVARQKAIAWLEAMEDGTAQLEDGVLP